MDPNELLGGTEQIKALISLLQKMVAETDNKEIEKNSVVPKERTATIKTKNRKRVSDQSKETKSKNKQTGINKFESMSEFRMHKDDSVIDKKLSKVEPVARMREFDFIDVVCRVCGKKENIAPSLLFDIPSRYKCNNCSTSAG